jgi:hypothetical protein
MNKSNGTINALLFLDAECRGMVAQTLAELRSLRNSNGAHHFKMAAGKSQRFYVLKEKSVPAFREKIGECV